MKHLEPVVKKSSSYSVLLLRDDSGVVRFRLKPGWIKFLAILLVVFCGASGASGYAAHYYWKKYQALQLERRELTEKLGENRRQLGRFAGVERIKESTFPRSTMAGVTTIAGGSDAAESPENGAAPGAGPAQSNGTAGNGTPPSPGETPSPPPEPSSQSAALPASGSGGAAAPAAPPGDLATTPASPEPSAQAGQAAPGEGGEHPALINEVQIRSSGGKSFKLAFDLSNRDQQITLNGRVTVAVGAKNGIRHEITQINRDTLRFIINRYKRVNTSFTLPDDLNPDDVSQLYLTVTADDQPAVTFTFSVSSVS